MFGDKNKKSFKAELLEAEKIVSQTLTDLANKTDTSLEDMKFRTIIDNGVSQIDVFIAMGSR